MAPQGTKTVPSCLLAQGLEPRCLILVGSYFPIYHRSAPLLHRLHLGDVSFIAKIDDMLKRYELKSS